MLGKEHCVFDLLATAALLGVRSIDERCAIPVLALLADPRSGIVGT